jgi:hypothetical protein
MFCRTIVASGADGMTKIVLKFVDLHPSVSKRQVEIKINELAIKEKRATDTQKVWHIRREFEHLLEDPAEKDTALAETKKKSDSAATSGKKRKTVETTSTVEDAKPSASTAKKSRAAPAPAEPVPDTSKPAKSTPVTPKSAPPTTPKSEKKFKTAFEIFVKEKRAEVEADLGEGADVRAINRLSPTCSYLVLQKGALKSELRARWLALSESEQDVYEKKLERFVLCPVLRLYLSLIIPLANKKEQNHLRNEFQIWMKRRREMLQPRDQKQSN